MLIPFVCLVGDKCIDRADGFKALLFRITQPNLYRTNTPAIQT